MYPEEVSLVVIVWIVINIICMVLIVEKNNIGYKVYVVMQSTNSSLTWFPAKLQPQLVIQTMLNCSNWSFLWFIMLSCNISSLQNTSICIPKRIMRFGKHIKGGHMKNVSMSQVTSIEFDCWTGYQTLIANELLLSENPWSHLTCKQKIWLGTEGDYPQMENPSIYYPSEDWNSNRWRRATYMIELVQFHIILFIKLKEFVFIPFGWHICYFSFL